MTGRISIGSNKSVIGVGSTAKLTGNGFNINAQSNVIVRNLYIGFVEGNDGITIQKSTRVWIDHNEFQSDISKGPDFYDGQVDIIHASDWVTISWNYFHDHWKVSQYLKFNNLKLYQKSPYIVPNQLTNLTNSHH